MIFHGSIFLFTAIYPLRSQIVVRTTEDKKGLFAKINKCLHRYVSTGVYYAKIKRLGKDVRRSLQGLRAKITLDWQTGGMDNAAAPALKLIELLGSLDDPRALDGRRHRLGGILGDRLLHGALQPAGVYGHGPLRPGERDVAARVPGGMCGVPNHPLLHQEVSDFLLAAHARNFAGTAHDFYEEADKGHGRLEIRRHWITADVGWSRGVQPAGSGHFSVDFPDHWPGGERSCASAL